MKNIFFKVISLFILLVLFSCESNRWEVDTEKITINQSINRFEQDLFALREDGITAEEVADLAEKYPEFYPLFVEGIMGFGRVGDSKTLEILNEFVKNEDIQTLFQDVEKSFPKEGLEKKWAQLHDGFKRFHYYFPNRVIPRINTMVSAFSYAAAADDSLLAIGLDTYLGADYPVYPQVGIPKYKFKNFSKEYIVSDALNAWLLTEFETEGGQNLLEQMVFKGKVAYLTKALLPKVKLEYVFNYDSEDLEWCNKNESGIWFHFVDMELLFATESHQIRKYMGDAPFVAGFPEGSPGRVGNWVGYKIVEAYMDNNEEVGLKELMDITDANKILRESNYKPNR